MGRSIPCEEGGSATGVLITDKSHGPGGDGSQRGSLCLGPYTAITSHFKTGPGGPTEAALRWRSQVAAKATLGFSGFHGVGQIGDNLTDFFALWALKGADMKT